MNTTQHLRHLAMWLLCLAMCHGALRAQDAEEAQDDGREVRAKEALRGRREGNKQQPPRNLKYRVKQPPAPPRRPVPGNKPRGKNRPARPVAPAVAQKFPVGQPPAGQTYLTLGVTLWNVREATPAERQQELTEPMTWGGQERQALATRITGKTSVQDGSLLQMSLEYLPTSRSAAPVGYLYVINYEEFADGSWRNARLLFPTELTYRGDNSVRSGQMVTLPGPQRPFRVTRSRDGQLQQYETYLIIVTPEKMDAELPQAIGRKAMELPTELVARWNEGWGAGAVRADLLQGAAQRRTQAEIDASGDANETRGTGDAAEDLTQDDAPPQMVFRKAVTTGGRMLVTIKLPFQEARRP